VAGAGGNREPEETAGDQCRQAGLQCQGERQNGSNRHQELYVSGTRGTERVARQNQGSRDRRAAHGEEKALPGPEDAMYAQRRNEGRDG